MSSVPPIRLLPLNRAAVNPAGDYVVYWMTMNRRPWFNFALQRAVEEARRLGRPLLVLEALRLGYEFASDRLHSFILQGMAANQAALAGRGVLYYPYVETEPDQGKGLLLTLARQACLVVADHFPCFFPPRMLAAAARRSPVRLEAVDACGLLPLAAAPRDYPTAHAFRRLLHQELPGHLVQMPLADPLADHGLPAPADLPGGLTRRWPPARPEMLMAGPEFLAGLAIDHAVGPVALAGGWDQARARLGDFLDQGLARYDQERSQPEAGAASGLSPHLHFGHIASQEVFLGVAGREGWSPQRLAPSGRGQRAGWWGMSPAAEAFLDQLVTWRELGFNMCQHRPDHDRYESLPAWARATLEDHAADPRPHVYSLEELEGAATHDQVWNAAQRQLLQEGVIAGYPRMLWVKKILQWSPSPRRALEIMLELNNRWALDGRDPNSYSGIFWVLGRHDRAFGPRRPIFGTVRYMSSANTRRKLRLAGWLGRFGPPGRP